MCLCVGLVGCLVGWLVGWLVVCFVSLVCLCVRSFVGLRVWLFGRSVVRSCACLLLGVGGYVLKVC